MNIKNNKPINKTDILRAVDKALMAADAHYHGWPAQQQEIFRATMSEKSQSRVRRVLLDNLLGIKYHGNEPDEVLDETTPENIDHLNWASLLTCGIGEDYILLNEIMPEGKTLLDYTTLYDYDYDDYLIQQLLQRQDNPDYLQTDYYAYSFPLWARLLIEDKFYYATLTSLATQLFDDIEEVGYLFIQQLIPHKYVEGKNHAKQDARGSTWDMQVDADGLEDQLDELNSRWHHYARERWDALNKSSTHLSAGIYSVQRKQDNEPHILFIFNNQTTLKNIRWAYEKQLSTERDNAQAFLTENHTDILAHYNPDVIIIMTPGALDDLDKI